MNCICGVPVSVNHEVQINRGLCDLLIQISKHAASCSFCNKQEPFTVSEGEFVVLAHNELLDSRLRREGDTQHGI